MTVEVSGFHCIYKTSSTDIGTLTGSANTESNPTLDIEATIPRTGGRSGAFCGSTAKWTGSYKVTAPNPLNVDDTVDIQLAAPTFGVDQTLMVTATNTGNVTWMRLSEDWTIDSGAWFVDLNESCEPKKRNPGESCTRKLKCLSAGKMTWSMKVESDKEVTRERTITIVCDK